MSIFAELRRRGVLGAVVAYGVAAAGALQLADIVVHSLELPPWSLRLLIFLAAVGLPVTAVVSWFYDLTRHGLVRTQMPASPPLPSPPLPAAIVQEVKDGAVLGGRYRLEGELGKGAMGRVLAAHDAKLDRRVAIKVVTGAHDPARIQRFIQEARTAGAIEHPNILAVYDLGEHEGAPFLVTELLEGQTLRTLLGDGPLPAPQAQSLTLQLAHGLAAAHARGIVHRDLKPENLFVTKDGRLKILDFGLARLVSGESGPGLTQTGAVFGTPGYLSPEQARGEKAGPQSDVFSAGAVIYEMLSGQRAFPGDSLVEAGHATLTAEPRPLPLRTPPALEAAVARAMRKEPGKRFANGGELSRALDAMGAPAPAPVKGRSWRRSTAVMVALAALALGAAAASALRVTRSTVIREIERHEATNARRDTATGRHEAHKVPPDLQVPVIPKPPQPPGANGSDDEPDNEPDGDQLKSVADGRKIAEDVARQLKKKSPHWGRVGMLVGLRAIEHAHNPAKTEAFLRKQAKRDPLAHLELFLLMREQNRTDEAKGDLQGYLGANPGDDWPAPLFRAYLGELPDEAVLAKRDPDELCDANYYLGRLHAPTDAAVARTQLQRAANEKCDESDSAQEALKNLASSR
jgi:serine/threonine protein kinase